jgi:hypothetical protein
MKSRRRSVLARRLKLFVAFASLLASALSAKALLPSNRRFFDVFRCMCGGGESFAAAFLIYSLRKSD